MICARPWLTFKATNGLNINFDFNSFKTYITSNCFTTMQIIRRLSDNRIKSRVLSTLARLFTLSLHVLHFSIWQSDILNTSIPNKVSFPFSFSEKPKIIWRNQSVSEELSLGRGNAMTAPTNYRITLSAQNGEHNIASNLISVTKEVRTTSPFELA